MYSWEDCHHHVIVLGEVEILTLELFEPVISDVIYTLNRSSGMNSRSASKAEEGRLSFRALEVLASGGDFAFPSKGFVFLSFCTGPRFDW